METSALLHQRNGLSVDNHLLCQVFSDCTRSRPSEIVPTTKFRARHRFVGLNSRIMISSRISNVCLQNQIVHCFLQNLWWSEFVRQRLVLVGGGTTVIFDGKCMVELSIRVALKIFHRFVQIYTFSESLITKTSVYFLVQSNKLLNWGKLQKRTTPSNQQKVLTSYGWSKFPTSRQ